MGYLGSLWYQASTLTSYGCLVCLFVIAHGKHFLYYLGWGFYLPTPVK